MYLIDKNNHKIQATKHYWHGGFFGDIAKQSLFVEVFANYFHNHSAVLLLPGENTNNDQAVVIEHLSDHPHYNYFENNYVTLTSGFNFLTFAGTAKRNNIFYFPYWLFFSRLVQRDDETEFSQYRKHSVSCLNHQPRTQRIYNLVSLYDRHYFDQLYCSFGARDQAGFNRTIDFNKIDASFEYHDSYEQFENNHSTEAIFYRIIKYFGRETLKKFKTVHDQIPGVNNFNIFDEYYHCARINEPGWADTYLNLVTEPQIDNIGFISEKIFKPLRAEQLFLVQGCPGSVKYLRSIGFDTFDDYIDHDRYDHEPDWIKRINLCLQVLDEIYTDIPKIFSATVQRRANNRKYLASRELNDLLLTGILQSLEAKFFQQN